MDSAYRSATPGKNKTRSTNEECNCKKGIKSCPLDGKCLRNSVIYQAEVKSVHQTSTYIAIALNTFKERFTNLSASFRNSKY